MSRTPRPAVGAARGATRGAGLGVWLVAAGVAACASPGVPPGGPEDRNAPVIVTVTPDSGATAVTAKGVTVRFNEVVSERPRGGSDLSAVVVLSPSDGPARVDWNRSAITVRPRKGFRANTTYSLSILPGLGDLRGNVTTRQRTLVFSTGATIARSTVRGAVFDWTTLRTAGNALLDARIGADTTFRWIARADSSGRYVLPFMPAGTYTVRTIMDANNNGRLDPREPWDSVTVTLADSLRLDLYAFAHDTLGARVVGADVKDSVTMRLTFDRPLALEPALTAGQVEIRRPDSSLVRVRSVTRAALFDSLARVREATVRDSTLRADTSKAGQAARARADSTRIIAERDSIERARVEARRAARDTVQRVPPPVPGRQAISADYVLVLADPLVPATYRILTRDVVSASRVTRTSERSFTRSKPAEKKGDAADDKPGAAAAKPGAAAAKPTPPPSAGPPAVPAKPSTPTRPPAR